MSKSLVPNSTSQQELTRIFRIIEQELTGIRKSVASSGSTSQALSASSASSGQQQTIQNISYIGPKGRRHVLVSTPILSFYETAYVECEFTESCDMISVKSSHPAWIRVYSSAAARLEDASRPYSADPLPGHGIMGEVATYEPGFLEIGFSPVPFFNNNDAPIGKTAYIAVTSMASGYVGVIDLDFSILPQEQTGVSGIQGKTGLNGRDGVNGIDGRTILSGTTDPGPTDGVDGDYFLKNGNTLFGPKSAGVWPAGISLIGPPGTNGLNGSPGADGNTILYGATNPGPSDGVNGNYWINNTSHTLFGPKAAGAWPAGISLIGPAGANGVGVPAGGTTHQVLRKVNATDYNTEWGDPASASRLSVGYTTATLAPSATETGTVALKKTSDILKIVTNYPAWIRLYGTAAQRTADASRLITQDPAPGAGVFLDASTSSSLDLVMSPIPTFSNGDGTPADVGYLSVKNLDSTSRVITVTITYLPQEA